MTKPCLKTLTKIHSELISTFDCFPDGYPILGVPDCTTSDSSQQTDSRDRSVPPARPYSPDRRSSPIWTPLRVRSRSPTARCIVPTRLPSSDGSGYELEELEFIRLIPNKNPHRIFLLQKYTFADNKVLYLAIGHNKFVPIKNKEQIVLSTFGGEVFAILENSNLLAGIYGPGKRRVRVNIESGATTQMTRGEIREAQVGPHHPIICCFKIENINPRVNHNTPDQ
ncbi:uncharacterized protein LOC117173194 [Belonocnema kinseyi]|uniref:uncharacterized protein LOC117173194 n=1 Tax=Belonocnema kinseyi TaxID=2817044 RepID=UPI00143DC3C6|nr:uncharacterized protein LOC117173194 [Belonocnema kinseyi]